MTLSFDVFWSFRSPYCYFALDRLLEIRRLHDVTVTIRPVYPIAVRSPEFFKRVNPLYRPYHLMDSKRVAEHLGLPYRRPVPDPIVQDLKTGEIASEQPYIRRVTRLGAAAQMAGRSVEFVDRISRMLWDGSTDDWHTDEHLAAVLVDAGLDAGVLLEDVMQNPDEYERQIRDNQDAHHEAGHWGVPTMVFEGEPFFGQDRIDMLLWRMRQRGLKPRR